jgi:HEAT repeat protein
MAVTTAGIDHALGAIGTTFRLVRLYPPTHPAVQEALRQISAVLPPLAALGILEWKVGATGLHWQGQQLLPRNAQLGELAGLLFARGVRLIQLHPGLTPEHVLALFNVAMGIVPTDDASLGRIIVRGGRGSRPRVSGPFSTVAMPAPSAPPVTDAPPSTPPEQRVVGAPASVVLPADLPVPPPPPPAPPAPPPQLAPPGPAPGAYSGPPDAPGPPPPDVEARRALTALKEAADAAAQRAAVERLQSLAGVLLQLRDATVVAEVIAGLDEALSRVTDGATAELVGAVASTLADPPTIQRMVARLGEVRVPPAERQALISAVGALGAVTAVPVLDAFLATSADLREPYRAAIRVAADRAAEPLQSRLEDRREDVVTAVAEFLGLTGSPAAAPLLLPLTRHRSASVRERALLALAEIGGREVSRPAVPVLKDENAAVRAAAARTVGVGGDQSASPLLVRRLEIEEDEGVLAELLNAIGKLGAKEALEVLTKWAEPGGRLTQRTPFVRAAAVDAIARLPARDARALLELYRQDKDPAVRRAAEAALK